MLNIFFLVAIIILLIFKIYKNKNYFFENKTYFELPGLMDSEARQINLESNKSCKDYCNTNDDCKAYQKNGDTCLISIEEINNNKLVYNTRDNPMFISGCSQKQVDVPPCNAVEKQRRQTIINMCANKIFSSDCQILTNVCKNQLDPCT